LIFKLSNTLSCSTSQSQRVLVEIFCWEFHSLQRQGKNSIQETDALATHVRQQCLLGQKAGWQGIQNISFFLNWENLTPFELIIEKLEKVNAIVLKLIFVQHIDNTVDEFFARRGFQLDELNELDNQDSSRFYFT
jgi:hypothetical protein